MPNIYFEILNEEICKYAKLPTPAIFGLPIWWKDFNTHDPRVNEKRFDFLCRDIATAKNCPALNDSFNFGYIVYNPIDVFIDATEDSAINYSVPEINLSVLGEQENSYIGFHGNEQISNLRVDERFHPHALKLNTFFGISTDDGYSIWITHPIGRDDLPFKILDAVIDTDKYTTAFPYAMFIKRGFKGIIKAGTPLIQVIPFKRDDFNSHIVKSNPQEIKSTNTILNSRFTNSYKKFFWSRKKFK